MMGAEPGRPNELSPVTRIDTARVRPVQSAAGRSFIEPGSPWQNPFVESFGSRVRDEVLSVEAFDSVLEAQTVITDWRKRCSLLARKVPSKRGNFREPPQSEVRRTPQPVEKVGIELKATTNRAWKAPKPAYLVPNSGVKAGTKGVFQQADPFHAVG